tara:strand:- start:29 stop:412 length:384 start_codon:yes stop_codon:yes gene_type:complete
MTVPEVLTIETVIAVWPAGAAASAMGNASTEVPMPTPKLKAGSINTPRGRDGVINSNSDSNVIMLPASRSRPRRSGRPPRAPLPTIPTTKPIDISSVRPSISGLDQPLRLESRPYCAMPNTKPSPQA